MVIFQVGDADMMSSEVAVQSVELFIYLFIFGYSFLLENVKTNFTSSLFL